MQMHWVDWTIVAAVVAGMAIVAWAASRLTRSVADFLAANRSAGRYLLTVASGMSGLGAISIAAHFEKFYEAGFAGIWWAQMLAPLSLVLALSGFVIYRYRETRALTMAQFFEMRYSRRFRVFSGILAWLSGILNYGIFPAVTARFLIYFTGLPTELSVAGWTVPMLAVVMAVMLSLALTLTLSGGQIAVMITDFLQGQFVNITLLLLLGVLFWKMNWSELIAGLEMAPAGQSKINPFKQEDIPDFNVWFFMIAAFLSIYGYKAWQGSQGYNAAARNPHEAKMAGILGEFRGLVTVLLVMLMPIFMYAMLNLPQFQAVQDQVSTTLATIDNEQIQKQMRVPAALSAVLPVGVMGLFAAVVVAAAVSTDDTYLHSWGSIFIQDVIMPFRRKPLTPKQHIRLLRISIISVAVFAWCFSLLFPLHEYIYMYFQITGAIFLGGAGSVILGGLYWKRGTVEGAWGAMITGSTLAVGGIFLANVFWPYLLPGLQDRYPQWNWLVAMPEKFPLNGMYMALISAGSSVAVYVVLSLLSRRPPADMDKLLHRGAYAVEKSGHHPLQTHTVAGPVEDVMLQPARSWRQAFWRRLGVGPDFTRGDKVIYLAKIIWVLFFFGIFVLGTAAALSGVQITDATWIRWWAFQVAVTALVGALTTIWFLIGGFHDLVHLVRALRATARDASDDGTVLPDEHVQRTASDESEIATSDDPVVAPR